MATLIRRTSGAGAELVAFFFAVLRGKPISRPGSPKPHRPTLDQRIAAAQWLADRGWGKAKELVELTSETTTPAQRLALLRRLSDDERAQLRALLAKALATPDPEPASSSPAVHLEPADPAGSLEAGAPVTLGQPRNVGRASAPELGADERGDDAQAPARGPDAEPAGS